MNSVSTQTSNTKEVSTQVNNINFIIEDNINVYSKSFDCKYNKIIL